MIEEKRYPIYQVDWRWDQSDYENNSSGYTIMKREPVDVEVLTREAITRWKKYVKTKNKRMDKQIPLKDKHPILLEVRVRFLEVESWCCGWFSHYTYNTEMSDWDLNRSFSEFLSRKEKLNIKNGHMPNNNISDNIKPFYCSMGANDRWRWKEPCRCKHCVKRGIVKIDH